jgi:hypothetical protein
MSAGEELPGFLSFPFFKAKMERVLAKWGPLCDAMVDRAEQRLRSDVAAIAAAVFSNYAALQAETRDIADEVVRHRMCAGNRTTLAKNTVNFKCNVQ